MKWLIAVALITACSSKTSNPPPQQPPAGSGTASGSAATPPPADDKALIAKVCAAGTCTGEMARIEVWRDVSGAIGRLVYDGDLQRCSHPPRSYHDRDGKQTLAIPFEPVEPGSPKALEYERSQKEQLDGLTKDRQVFCGKLP
jgi:hypothetical protein